MKPKKHISSPRCEHVILLHGLCRTPASLRRVAAALRAEGFVTHNIAYPSRTASTARLADDTIGPAIRECEQAGAVAIHFVGHSLGCILVRSYLRRHPHPPALGRVVMLAPPNQGSEVVDHLRDWKLYQWITGPVGQELGTDAASVPLQIGAVDFAVGVLAGSRTINWINSAFFLKGVDDGKVSVARTRVEGMADHRVLPATHTFITSDGTAIRQTIHFLRNGKFA
ncbi:MAG: hypothetical protein LBV28_02710 [Puniceicoccales bacterium]|nr:hypothetical protein [Puniceicoccales bacterium]